MKQISGKEFIRLVQQRGWLLRRINGSHHIFTKQGHRERIVIPVHGNQPLKLGLLKETPDENSQPHRSGFVIGWEADKT